MDPIMKVLISAVSVIILGATGYAVNQSRLDGSQNERIAIVETVTAESAKRLVRIERKIDGLYDLATRPKNNVRGNN